jgi:hypothetical protein
MAGDRAAGIGKVELQRRMRCSQRVGFGADLSSSAEADPILTFDGNSVATQEAVPEALL